MFSRRTAGPRALNALAQAQIDRGGRRPFIDLTLSNPARAGLAFPDPAALREALSQETVLDYDPHPFGQPAARAALAAWLSRHGLPLAPERLCLTASTSEAYGFLFKLLCDPGDSLLVPQPSYPLFDDLAGLEGLQLRPYPLRYDGDWHVDLAALRRSLSTADPASPVRAVIAIHPNNPTGNFLKAAELDALLDLCATHQLALISDEVFHEHGLWGSPSTAPAAFQPAARAATRDEALVFSLGGLSKLLCLPQLKLSWIATNGPPALVTEALARLELCADTALSVSAPVQVALPYLLRQADQVLADVDLRLRRNLAALDRAIARAPAISRPRCEAGWTALLRLPAVRPSEAWALWLLQHADVLVQPGYFYGLWPDCYVVLSLLCDEAEFSAGVSALAAAVAGAGG